MQAFCDKSAGEAGLGEFVQILKYKAAKNKIPLPVVAQRSPSSQLCFGCGYQNKVVKDLAVREWVCPQCGISHHRDVTAARNNLIAGELLASLHTAVPWPVYVPLLEGEVGEGPTDALAVSSLPAVSSAVDCPTALPKYSEVGEEAALP